jgi:hypothetical protein
MRRRNLLRGYSINDICHALLKFSKVSLKKKIMSIDLSFEPLFKAMVQQPAIYRHGKGFDDCEICLQTIEPGEGKRVELRDNSKRFICHVCNYCYNESDYQELLSRKQIISIKNM